MSISTYKFQKYVKSHIPLFMKSWLNAIISNNLNNRPPSSDYRILNNDSGHDSSKSWQNNSVAENQYYAFKPIIDEMHRGKPRKDFLALSSAVKMTELNNPLIVEVGCGNGWNSDVLNYLLDIQIRYCGIDISKAMTMIGKKVYPDSEFIVGSATSLPIQDQSCDILVSGTVLMHLLGYKEAINESFRVTRKWCIFHTIPVLKKRGTTLLEKNAYGQPTIEVIFNENEFIQLIENNGFVIKNVIDSIPYDLKSILGETTVTKTYVCEAIRI